MIGFISTDYLWAAKMKNCDNVQYFLISEATPRTDEAQLGFNRENVTLLANLVPSKSDTKRFEKIEDGSDFEACVNKYFAYLSENELLEVLETIIEPFENGEKNIVFLSYYEDASYLEALAIIVKRQYGLQVLGTTELCGRSMYIPDYIGIDNLKH